MRADLKVQPNYTNQCPLHPVRVAGEGRATRQSVNGLTHNSARNSEMSADALAARVFFVCALLRGSGASSRLACLSVPWVQALQGGLELVSRGYDALTAGEPQTQRRRSVLGHPSDELVHGSGCGGDLLGAAAVFVFSCQRESKLRRWRMERRKQLSSFEFLIMRINHEKCLYRL